MNRKVLEDLRDLIAPMSHPDPERAAGFNAALHTFRELVDTVIAAEDAGLNNPAHIETVLGMYGDLLVEQDELTRGGGVPKN